MRTEGYFSFAEALRGGTRPACPRNLVRSPKKLFEKIAGHRNFFVEPNPKSKETQNDS
jgi:hypothetical protein